jgi:hypothetical protein
MIVSYVNEYRHRIFLAHFYLRPDGSLGASGLPDSKWLFEDGIVYRSFKERRPGSTARGGRPWWAR